MSNAAPQITEMQEVYWTFIYGLHTIEAICGVQIIGLGRDHKEALSYGFKQGSEDYWAARCSSALRIAEEIAQERQLNISHLTEDLYR